MRIFLKYGFTQYKNARIIQCMITHMHKRNYQNLLVNKSPVKNLQKELNCSEKPLTMN